jgi:hypothetical protein
MPSISGCYAVIESRSTNPRCGDINVALAPDHGCAQADKLVPLEKLIHQLLKTGNDSALPRISIR